MPKHFAYLLSAALCVVVACARTDYGVAIRNATASHIRDAHVSFGDFRSVGGGIQPGLWVVHLDVGKPIPETAVVEWRSSTGEQHRKTVDVRDVVPPGFDGKIFFDIMPDGTVQVIARDTPPALPNPTSS